MKVSVIIFAILLASCAGTQKPAPFPPPEWAAAPYGMETVYPHQNFIAQKGYGTNRTAAENDALAHISRYFSTQIKAKQLLVQHSLEENGILTAGTELIDEIYTRSETELFTVRYAQSWYNPAEQQWQTVAYINRDEAWAVYEPRARREADKFLTMCRTAAQAEESIRRYAAYSSALILFEKRAAAAVFFAETLHPAKAAAVFARVQDALTEIPAAMNEARANSYIYLRCDVDFEGRIRGAAEQAWSALGFPVQKTRTENAVVCTITVSDNETAEDSGGGSRIFSFSPSVSLVLAGKAGSLFVWNSRPVKRIMTATRDVGRRRAYTALAAEFEQSFPAFFREKMGGEQ